MMQLNYFLLRASKLLVAAVLAALALTLLQLASAPKASAAYQDGRLIDDVLFLDAQSMSANQIQSFLESKSGQLKDKSFKLDCDAPGIGTTSKQLYLNAGAPCGSTIPASQIIYYAAQIYGLSPKVILATLQKEQSLITNPSPGNWEFNQAMGYNCPTSGHCDDNSGFFFQIDNGTWVLRYHYERARGNNSWWNSNSWTCGTAKPSFYTPNLYPGQNVNFIDPYSGIHYKTVFIENAATSALYCYTPHVFNNHSNSPHPQESKNPRCYSMHPASGDRGRCYTGSYNFVSAYEMWFGSTQAFVHKGVNYGNVFDPDYYILNNPDVVAVYGNDYDKVFQHFLDHGMKEGRRGNESFDVISYRNRHPDLRVAYRKDLASYYKHYASFGKGEGRVATGAFTLVPIETYAGKSYSDVYKYTKYLDKNADLKPLFSNDDAGAIEHFVNYGMGEAREASSTFSLSSYRGRYYDLRKAFGSDMKKFYLHYIHYGKGEGRIATGSQINGTSILNGTDYSSVYSFSYYRTINSDIKASFQLNDIAALQHFVNYGMGEGRRANDSFNVNVYRSRYPDLSISFGNNTRAYYLHYIHYGRFEGRNAN